MSNKMKRTYKAEGRQAQAAQTRSRILIAAQELFQVEGFETVTIDRLANAAQVSSPTVYALFQSKRGILHAILDEALPADNFEALVEESKSEHVAANRLKISAKIARQIYEAENVKMQMLRGASVLAPEFKELEKERELRRYGRQEETICTMWEEGALAKDLEFTKARDILWSLTGRDMYRMLVVERGWTSDEYESWLAQTLIQTLLAP